MINNLLKKIYKFNSSFYGEILVLIIIFLSWLVFNRLTPISNDDIIYQYIIGTNGEVRVTSIADIFISQYNHYMVWGGRTVAHALDQFFLMYDKLYFDIFNSLVFVISVYLIYSFRKNKERNSMLLIFIFLSYWFFGADLYRPYFYQTSSFNYSWMIFFSLAFIKVYYSVYDGNRYGKTSIFASMLFFIFSILAGWGHEVISPVVVVTLIIYFLNKYKNKLRISNIEVCGFIGYLIGTLLLICAPGNFARAKAVDYFYLKYDFIPFFKYVVAFFRNGYFVIYYATPILIVMGMVLIITYLKIRSDKTAYINEIHKIGFYMFILFFSTFFYFFMLGYANACVIVPLTIMLIVIVRYFDYIEFNEYFIPISFVIIMFTLLFLIQSIATVYYIINKGSYINHFYNIVVN